MSTTTTTAPPSFAKKLSRAMGGNVRQYGMIIALLLLIAMFQVLTGGLFLEPRNVTSLLVQNGYILILAIGMVMVIICLLYTSPSPRDKRQSRMPSSA